MDALYFLRTIAALGTVLGLLVGALWAVRRYNISLPGQTGGRSSKRLALVERLGIDARRSVILVRRDDREHLIMVAPDGQMVIESNIVREPQPDAAVEDVVPAAKVQQDFATLVDLVGSAGAKAKSRAKSALAKREKAQPESSQAAAQSSEGGSDFAALVDRVSSVGAKARAALQKTDRPIAETSTARPKARAKTVESTKPKRPAVQLKVTAPDGSTLIEPVHAAAAMSAAKAA